MAKKKNKRRRWALALVGAGVISVVAYWQWLKGGEINGRYRGMSYQLIRDPPWEPRGEGTGRWEWNAIGIKIGRAPTKAAALAAVKKAMEGWENPSFPSP